MAGDEELPSLDDWGPSDEDDWGLFPVPPPPPPPSLGPSACSELHCHLEGGPMGAHYNRAAFPSLPIIAVCSSVVLVAVLVASFLFWRHKTKAQNLLPCKNEQPGHMGDLVGTANGVSYEDGLLNHHATRIPPGHPLAGNQAFVPLELIDVKLGEIGPPQITPLHACPYQRREGPALTPSDRQQHFHSVYEEVPQAPTAPDLQSGTAGKTYESTGRSVTSEDDDFGEGSGNCSATSSVRGSTGGDLCRDPVSSDGEDCGDDDGFMVHDMPTDNSFSYPAKHAKTERPGEQFHVPRDHRYLHPDRTGGDRHKVHSKTHRSPQSRVPSIPFVPPADPRNNFRQTPLSPQQQQQWASGSQDRLDYPANNVSSSQENIYSTIDGDEDLVDYPARHHPPLASLVASPSGNKYGPVNVPSKRSDRPIPPLSQRNTDESGSYGDFRPPYNSAFM